MSTATTTTSTAQSKCTSSQLASKVALVDLTKNNVGTVRKINSVLFPVRYSDKFYTQILDESLADFCKLIYFNDLPVGSVCCRVEVDLDAQASTHGTTAAPTPEVSEAKLYIMTLGVLAPYRRLGLATKLLDHVFEYALKTHDAPPPIPQPEPAPAPIETKKTVQKSKKAASNKAHETAKLPAKPAPVPSEEDQIAQLPKLNVVYVHVQVGNEDAKAFYLHHGFELSGDVKDYYRKIEPRDAWIFSKRVLRPVIV